MRNRQNPLPPTPAVSRQGQRNGRPSALIKGVPHVKKQTGRECVGTLVHDPYYQEYSCLACGWCADDQAVLAAIQAAKLFKTRLVL